jgi:magnesium-transporting ATPase (P-type)
MEICSIDASKRSKYEEVLSTIAQEGLRTLCVAFKRVEKEVALQWQDLWKKAASSLQNRSENLAAAAAMMEVELQLLGVSAIEDRLQDEVPEVLADLAAAGITLWMLTGDKEETAVNIGYSCNLLRKNFKLFYATGIKDNKELREKLKEISDKVCPIFSIGINEDKEQINAFEKALVLDGPSFKYFDENDSEMRQEIIQIAKNCQSVIACRLTPAQKQLLVSMMKNDAVPKAITLAIGDGANDVSMILEADVGVGIIGKEGRQAANSADFAVGQFKALRRLILVHGRWNYVRQSKAFFYCMHKNMVIAITLFWFRYRIS